MIVSAVHHLATINNSFTRFFIKLLISVLIAILKFEISIDMPDVFIVLGIEDRGKIVARYQVLISVVAVAKVKEE